MAEFVDQDRRVVRPRNGMVALCRTTGRWWTPWHVGWWIRLRTGSPWTHVAGVWRDRGVWMAFGMGAGGLEAEPLYELVAGGEVRLMQPPAGVLAMAQRMADYLVPWLQARVLATPSYGVWKLLANMFPRWSFQNRDPRRFPRAAHCSEFWAAFFRMHLDWDVDPEHPDMVTWPRRWGEPPMRLVAERLHLA